MMINTREIAEEYRLGHWAQVMQERISSGLSIKAYCRQIGISTNTYHYWQKKLREAAVRELSVAPEMPDNQTLVPSGWTECQPAPGAASSSNAVIIEIGECRITATASTDPDLLAKVCRALSQC